MKTITHALKQLFLTLAITGCVFAIGCLVILATPIAFAACAITIAVNGEIKVEFGDGEPE